MRPIVDPRQGDIEDDASSTKRRTLVSVAGNLLAAPLRIGAAQSLESSRL
jgi:hypothetical protein